MKLPDHVKNEILFINNYRINNAWKPMSKWLTQYHNKLIDLMVMEGGFPDFNYSKINQDITSAVYPQVLKKYQMIYKSSLVTSTFINKKLLEEKANNITIKISANYEERFGNNFKSINKILQDAEVNIAKYEKMAKSFPEVNRLNIIQKAADKGSNWKGQQYSFKQLENMNKGISKYIENQALQDKYELNFDESVRNAEAPAKQEKIWVWSQLENTRHSNMDGLTVDLKDTFTVVNEVTGEVDELLFPGDFENDSNNCSNICNCYCSVLYS